MSYQHYIHLADKTLVFLTFVITFTQTAYHYFINSTSVIPTISAQSFSIKLPKQYTAASLSCIIRLCKIIPCLRLISYSLYGIIIHCQFLLCIRHIDPVASLIFLSLFRIPYHSKSSLNKIKAAFYRFAFRTFGIVSLGIYQQCSF